MNYIYTTSEISIKRDYKVFFFWKKFIIFWFKRNLKLYKTKKKFPAFYSDRNVCTRVLIL